jgi:hypothetical protein
MFDDNVVNKQDIEDRLSELEDERDSFMEDTGFDEIEQPAEWEESLATWEAHQPEGQEWRMLTDIIEEIGHADYLVAEDYFEDYVKEMLQDCGDVPRELPWYVEIDWEATADNIKGDYGTIEIEGKDWYYRYS